MNDLKIRLRELAEKTVSELAANGQTVALAESCTGGLLAKSLTDVPGASHVFECGIVSYSEGIKQKVLGVKPGTLEQYSVVSPEVAAEMACGVRTLGSADYGIGITGVAGPGPDGTHPEGEIYVALSTENGTFFHNLNTPDARGREANRLRACIHALELLTTTIEGG